ncbi:MAG: phosphate transport system protein [Parasphingorhabdus sp.]|jgi:phosphate transport system protein
MYFKKEKKRLNKHLFQFSNSVEKQVSYAIQALSDVDITLSKRIVKANVVIGHSSVEIEEECLKLLALYQPVANDLRLIISVLKINGDLERIGDHAVIIAEEVSKMVALEPIDVPNCLYELSALAKIMLRKSLLGFVESDIQVAEDVLLQNKTLKELTDEVNSYEILAIKDNVETLEQHLSILNIARQIQRIADHAIHIAEDTSYLMKGEIIRHNG